MKRRKVPKRKKALRNPYFEKMRHRTGSGVHIKDKRNDRSYISYLLDYDGEIDEDYFDEIDQIV